MKIKSFGCSFLSGNELASIEHTWPSLIAKNLDLEHVCYAQPGIGNLQIMESIMLHSCPDDFVVVGWTYIDRFDFIDRNVEKWETLRPALDRPHADWYFQNIHSQYRDMLTNLAYVKTAIDHLKSQKFLMIAMDDLLFETVQPCWHHPKAVTSLQTQIRPHVGDFEGKNFLDWSRDCGFRISRKNHPLEDAHRAAADYMMPVIESILIEFDGNLTN